MSTHRTIDVQLTDCQFPTMSFQKSPKSVSYFEFWKSNSMTKSMVKKEYNQVNTTSGNNFGYYLFVGHIH